MFLDPVQSLFSLLSQILGLDYDALVTKVMLGILLFFFDPESSLGAFRFDDFMAQAMHIQLANFNQIKRFRHQNYLLKMILVLNWSRLQEMDSVLFTDLSIVSEESHKLSIFEFINKVMSRIYEI